MSLTDDEWIKIHSPIEAEKLHALGYITFVWNSCEFHLFGLFHLTFGIPQQLAWILVHDLGDIAISNRIRAFMVQAFSQPHAIQDIIDVVENALDAYDICRQNRNQFTHFRLDHDPDTGRLILRRQKKGPTLERLPFPDNLEDMRRVGAEIWGLAIQLTRIKQFLEKHGTDQAVPLPDRVQLPELLWKPFSPTPPKSKRPPGPSRA